MKCPNSECGFVGPGKFCHQCGNKMIDEQQAGTVVLCDGKRDDDTICGAELTERMKFCQQCGTKVKSSLFEIEILKCQGCGLSLKPSSYFCDECGLKKGASVAESSEIGKPIEKDTISGKDSDTMDAQKEQARKDTTHSASVITEQSQSTFEASEPVTKDTIEDGNFNDENGNEPQQKGDDSHASGKSGDMDGNQLNQGNRTENISIFAENHSETKNQANQTTDATDQCNMGKLKIYDDTNYDNTNNNRDSSESDGRDTIGEAGNRNIISPKRSAEQNGGNEKKVKLDSEREDTVLPEGSSFPAESERDIVMSGPTDNNDNQKLENDDDYRKQEKVSSDDSLDTLPSTDTEPMMTENENKSTSNDEINPSVAHTSPSTEMEPITESKEISSSPEPGMVFGNGRSIQPNAECPENRPKHNGLFTIDKTINNTTEHASNRVDSLGNKNNDRNKGDNKDTGTDVYRLQTRSMTKSDKTSKNTQKSGSDPIKSTGGVSRNQTDKIRVKFHILTSDQLKFDPEKHKCVLSIGVDKLGGWKNRSRVMKKVRCFEDNIYELAFEENISKDLITGGSNIPYKYSLENVEKDKIIWEDYYKKNNYDNIFNRNLTVTVAYKKIDVWHQFDGFFEVKDTSLKDRFVGLFKNREEELLKHAEYTIDTFCPEVNENGKVLNENGKVCDTMQSTVQYFRMINDCLRKIYYVDAKCFKYDTDFKEFMTDKFANAMIQKWHVKDDGCSNSFVNKDKATVCALTILNVFHALELHVKDKNLISILTKALVVRPDTKIRECPDFLLADSLFPEKRKHLLRIMVDFVKAIAMNSKNPCWLLLMPWIHFLSGACDPFQEPDDHTKHDDEKPFWWGLYEVSSVQTEFKKNYKDWSIPVLEMLRDLKPLFEIDYLLPRTFIASVDLKDLHILFEEATIPVDACLANLTYQVKQNRPQTYYSYTTGILTLMSPSLGEKIWNDVFAPIELQSKGIADVWNKDISEALLTCLKQNAIEQGYSLDYANFREHEKTRFGELLSDLFVKEWSKNVKHNTEDRMLRHALRWPPFPQYLKIFFDRVPIDDTLKKQEHLDAYPMKEFCEPLDISKVEDVQNFQTKLCAFKVTSGVIDMAIELHKISHSSTFMKLWKQQCNTNGYDVKCLDDVVEKLWRTVKKRLTSICDQIQSGCVKFNVFEQIIGKVYRMDYESMEKELRILEIPSKVISKRIDQLMKYRQLSACVNGAIVILKFVEEYELKGDFQQIKVIAKQGQTMVEMKSFNDSVMKAVDFLQGLTEERAMCLQTFVQCGKLVKWLKESMSNGGLKELKVFVDLAFLSAGDEPMNIARVQCLHSAVTGYAPLIFDLTPDCGYEKLLEHCAIVWKELEANRNLPKMLSDTNNQLEWMKEIKKAHGSVEVTSLMQAEAINIGGIYTVGKRRNVNQQNDSSLLNLADIFELSVREQSSASTAQQSMSSKDTQPHFRRYSFTQLQDLQSRLMLVAGKAEKGGDSVDRFTMIFDSLTRLSNVYLKLCSSGCVLFKDWSARFFCDPNPIRPVCVTLAFGQDDRAPKMRGRRSKTEDLEDMVPQLAKFMENCLEDWLQHIKAKRKNYIHLNYFTVDQLVILQSELMKVGTDNEVSHLIYPLLSAVKQNCTPDDLLRAMSEAKEAIDGQDSNDSDDGMETCNTSQEICETNDDEKRIIFMQEMIEAGYNKTLAIKALDHVDDFDISDGITWCLEHEDDERMDDEELANVADVMFGEEPVQEPAFSGWSTSHINIQSLIAENISGLGKHSDCGVKPLIADLTTLWKQFLESISSNVCDYLSLEHLGLILKYLSFKDTREIRRPFPPMFKEGEPNLVICPSADVLMTTLSLYIYDQNQPLPQSDEVLMCTPNTTNDEVDIFWRRAIFDDSDKIYCLVNADMLDYDVCEASERCLEEYLLDVYQKDRKYRLLVICSSDNEYRSTIISSLDKYKRQLLQFSIDKLRQYLINKLKVQDTTHPTIKPAAFVDYDRSTVRVIKSWRAGVGKSLYKTRREDDLSKLNGSVQHQSVSIPLQERNLNVHYVIQRLLEHSIHPDATAARLFHIDVSHEVQHGIDYLLFNLVVLGCLMDKTGWVWRKAVMDIYLIETMPLMIQSSNKQDNDLQYLHPMLNILPDVTCRSPVESLDIYMDRLPEGHKYTDQLFDQKLCRSPMFQRPFQYLYRLQHGRQLTDVNPHIPEHDQYTCLNTLLRHCGLENPSWAELHHFVWFLNTQLVDFEHNTFVGAAAAEDLPGFAQFVLRFLIQMSRDFSTRSLDMSEESPGIKPDSVRSIRGIERMDTGVDQDDTDDEDDDLQAYQMRRTWESSPHPYLFFNSDRFTFTFLGFNIQRHTGDLVDQQTGNVLESGIMAQNLYDGLVRNRAPMQENFDTLPRHEKIQKLCNVMGLDMPYDPDDSYELTTDNVKKILAIYMRFRCDIPVIIMGETGCGKTRLVKFMCALQVPPGMDNVTNMILMKVHGGTTHDDIVRKVREAEEIAIRNREELGEHLYTVLFFDEANTTEAIGLIKEIMCDKSMGGKRLKLCENLKIVAACNPYRKHSDELIKKLEQAGLGYHVDADETTDKLGRVPMRRLVYRVQPLPQSLLPLVWDFGQLNTQVEDLYIRQMVRRYIREDMLPDIQGLIEVVSAILTASQDYMRAQKDECSFVSLRDVDRVLTVMSWFYQQNENNDTLYKLMDKKLNKDDVNEDDDVASNDENDEDYEEDLIEVENRVDDITRSLILALGVCYHACLKTRPQYRQHIARYFRAPCNLPGGEDQMKDEIESCQEVFLDHVYLEKNIARNMALKENVFMMVVCIELRIPLFLVGKPGSSKSLAKTIVSDAMQGNAAKEDLFKELKQAQMVSFQCSPLSTPDGIVGTFKQCAQFQKDKDLDTFVSIVVLDEVGLAEDSPRMPLKVAFIGISNWALDPAKMNRGILVQREVPDLEELKGSAMGICQTEDDVSNWISPLIEPMAKSYLEIFKKASKEMREFYGLRDFYSLIKMVYSFVEKSKNKPTWHEMLHSIKRNFGGLDQVNPVECFKKHLATKIKIETSPGKLDPDCSPAGLIQACLFGTNQMKNESRYLLLLTENYGALSIIQQEILSGKGDIRPITIFGSSFRSDQEYTQVCRNINKIKVCMETGNTVVLLNLENLYESLYDALNQYYVYFGGERYVDLGLGTHRVKCPVHKKFRLIVVAEKQTVYDKFPIPLINRLEKHFLNIHTMLTEEQQNVVKQLEDWAKNFVTQNRSYNYRNKPTSETKVGDVFIGYHDDTCSAIVLNEWKKFSHITDDEEKLALVNTIFMDEIEKFLGILVFLEHIRFIYVDKVRVRFNILHGARCALLWCATPESLVKLENSNLHTDEGKVFNDVYHKQQSHESLVQYLETTINNENRDKALFAQLTTHSKLIAAVHKHELSKVTKIPTDKILLLETLSSFDTEQQFTNRIIQHIRSTYEETSLMIIQCDSGDTNNNLIACARYCVLDEFEKLRDEIQARIHVVFIVQLPRGAGFTGFQCGVWHSAHIDDLYTEDMDMPSLRYMQGKSVAGLISGAINDTVPMEVDDEPSKSASEVYEMETEDVTEDRHYTEAGHSAQNNNDTLKLDDVLLDLNSVGDSNKPHGMESSTSRLNVKKLMLNCVQAALCMVKDKTENTNKETDRVALVLTLLHQEHTDDQASFLRGICSLIAKLLQEKESKHSAAHMANHWLVNEAASNESINKAGTFRRSCLQTLEGKIAPILAGVIACLDTNDNLNILRDEALPWKQRLWLGFLNSQDTIQLQYGDLQSPTRQSDLKEVVVMTTGCEGHYFAARFPFSWIIMNEIFEILKVTKVTYQPEDVEDEEDKVHERIDQVESVLTSHSIGKIIQKYTDSSILAETVEEYTEDFIHAVYNASSIHEHQLVCQSVLYKAKQMMNDPTTKGVICSLIYIHIAYESLSRRLTYFHDMNIVWPECSEIIVNKKHDNPDHNMFKEQEFTFAALCMLIENLEPNRKDLDDNRGRSQWLNKVHRYRPVIEKVISLHNEDPRLYGAHSYQSVHRARCLWSRVLVVKLFLEHICASEKEDKITIKHCMPLWGIMGDEANFKERKSLDGLEKFLKLCNKQALKQYMGNEVKCCFCEVILEGPPVTLPCNDTLCDQCYNEIRILGETKCPKCHQTLQENWRCVKQNQNNDAIEKLISYQKRCNTFFMDVVSQLCFADNTSPSEEVIEKLLGYIFFTSRSKQEKRTRELTVFDTGIDPNPVFRSFLLQLLMSTSEEHVQIYLGRFLEHAEQFMKKDGNSQHYTELSLLVIQCFEDKFVKESKNVDAGKYHEAECALRELKFAVENINEEKLNVDKLYALAGARMGLAVAMKYAAEVLQSRDERRPIDHKMRSVLNAAKILSEQSNIKWIRIYALKYLCRNYGIEMYQNACNCPYGFIQWLGDNQDINRQQVVEVSDRYIVCGEPYTRLRESLTKVLLGENIEHLEETVQELHNGGIRVEAMLQLAVHREVTCSYIHNQQRKRLTPKVQQTLATFINECDVIKNKELMLALLQNELKYLTTMPDTDLRVQGTQCLIMHYLSVMSHFKGERTLLQPLLALMKNPQNCQQYYLPTMPQDDLDDVREALLAARNQVRGADHNPVFYRCPNGHPYVIGDCGRPATVGNCRDCGAAIGGEGYRLRPGNVQHAGGDNTMTGHILGRVDNRGRGPKPERMLTPAYCAITRLIVHLSMYLGCSNNVNAIQTMIKPDITHEGVIDYIWGHIQQDVDDIHQALGRSVDDVLLVMHTIIDNVMKSHNEGAQVANDVALLSSKDGRKNWETQFSTLYIQPLLQGVDQNLKKNNKLIAQDQRLGANPLLCLLYETETQSDIETPGTMENIASVWRYRTPVSLQHLRQELDAYIGAGQQLHKQFKVLQLFLQEEHYLRALRFIPSILKLQRALIQKYQRKLDKAEASQITVSQLKREAVAGYETVQLLQDFSDAWELVREHLIMYMCPTLLGGMTISKEYCTQSIVDTTPISILLPTTKEAGLCSYAMLDFLMRKQNDFLDRYKKESRRRSTINTVSPREVTSAHLISYNPDHDILPLILANCQYSFEMGKGTKIEYDFIGLERHLMDRFLFSKSKIDVGKVLQIDEMIYRTEFTNAAVFTKLNEKIPQKTLTPVVKSQITEEFKSFPDLCQTLDNIDIAISFLKSTGGTCNYNLHLFMVETLHMNEMCIRNQKARQMSEFQHCRSLWLLLSFLKAKMMMFRGQHTETIFESVSREYHEEMPLELMTQFKDYMKNLSVEKLSLLVEVLHEFILLKIAVRENHEDEDHTDSTVYKLKDYLYAYAEEMETTDLDLIVLEEFPGDILYKHSIYTWISAYQILYKKQTGNTPGYRRY
ncbi:hypothetical protein ACF0H5_007850 [Mactra antiquata]